MTLRRVLVAAVVVVNVLVTLGTGAAAAAHARLRPPRLLSIRRPRRLLHLRAVHPLMRLNPIGCARSTNNYPALLAAALRVRGFTDVSCGGADTTNMTKSQSVPLFGTKPAAVQRPAPEHRPGHGRYRRQRRQRVRHRRRHLPGAARLGPARRAVPGALHRQRPGHSAWPTSPTHRSRLTAVVQGIHQRPRTPRCWSSATRGSRPPPARAPTCCRSPTATTSTWTASNGPSTPRWPTPQRPPTQPTSTRTDRRSGMTRAPAATPGSRDSRSTCWPQRRTPAQGGHGR